MNLMDYPRKEYSISQFARPKCFELAGSELFLVMDSGYDYILRFTQDRVFWHIDGENEQEAEYMCFKGDDTTYFVSFEVSLQEDQTYVLDMSQRLVTQVLCKKGLNPKNRHIMDRKYIFGAIKLPGYRLPYKRHTFTCINQGTTVQWRWAPELFTKHAYLESTWYRITWDDDGEAAEDFDTTNEMLPSTDEHARFIKIKDNLILFSLTEEMEERCLGDIQHFRCDNLTLLQNYDRMYHVGRGFGDGVVDGKPIHIRTPLCAYGSPIELPDEFLNAKNPFTV